MCVEECPSAAPNEGKKEEMYSLRETVCAGIRSFVLGALLVNYWVNR